MPLFKRKKKEEAPQIAGLLERVKRELEEGKPSMEMIEAYYGDDIDAQVRLGFQAFGWKNIKYRTEEEIQNWENYKTMMETYAEAVKQAQIEAYKKDFLETLNIEDFPSMRAHMKKQGLVISAIQCPQCGASLKLPESGREIICDYCKTTLYANDIFKKIKSF